MLLGTGLRGVVEYMLIVSKVIKYNRYMTLRARQQVELQGVALFHADSCTAAGTLLNLAPSGCAIQSERCPSMGDYVNVALLIPDSDPVLADVAKVRWIEDGRFGLEFLRIEQGDQIKVAQLIQQQTE